MVACCYSFYVHELRQLKKIEFFLIEPAASLPLHSNVVPLAIHGVILMVTCPSPQPRDNRAWLGPTCPHDRARRTDIPPPPREHLAIGASGRSRCSVPASLGRPPLLSWCELMARK
jgi:hypothetical protein